MIRIFLIAIELKEIFHKTIDRIEIRRTSIYGPILEICYNVKKVGYYGICETKSKKFVKRGNWGFCSRACNVDEFPDDDEPYEEAEFRYFDTPPQGTTSRFHPGFIFFFVNNHIHLFIKGNQNIIFESDSVIVSSHKLSRIPASKTSSSL